jgi:hypothetical protein
MEEQRLWMFENTVLRSIFEQKRDEMKGGWRKLHNEELHNVYSSSNIIRMNKSGIRWAGHIACMGAKRNAFRVLVGKPQRKRPLGRPIHRQENNIKWIIQK